MKVADMHCDTILAIQRGREQGKEISLRKNNLNVDLERMKKGDYLIQNFAIFLDLEDPMLAGSPFRYAMKMADVFYREMEKNKDWIRPVTKYDEIEENRKNGRMSALLTLEEGEICEGDPALLRDFYRMGARMMTLTWNYPNQLGYPAKATGGEFAGKAFSEAGNDHRCGTFKRCRNPGCVKVHKEAFCSEPFQRETFVQSSEKPE